MIEIEYCEEAKQFALLAQCENQKTDLIERKLVFCLAKKMTNFGGSSLRILWKRSQWLL